jgi:diphosphomevalonate decarboxylase
MASGTYGKCLGVSSLAPPGRLRVARALGPRVATYEASPNIALVKYWGQRDTARVLPYNSSVSVTLAGLTTRTTVRFDPELPVDRLQLNGKWVEGGPLASASAFLERVRREMVGPCHAEVRTRNSFPTASGLASSASGFAALAGAASRAAGLDLSDTELSQLARYGSGSACRSVFGGFVEWRAGLRPDGSDCLARMLHPPNYWPELVDVVAVVADAPEKEVRSAVAMQTTVETCRDYHARQRALPRRIAAIRRLIRSRDGPRLFDEVMEECDDFRHVCETTEPALDYLTDTSRRILDAVRDLNREERRTVAGYTHDAGAHVHVFTLKPDLAEVRRRLRALRGIRKLWNLAPGPGGRYVRGTVR